MIIPLDSGPLGLLVSTEVSAATRECHNWVDSVIAAGTEIVLPEIVLYELRRELLRLNKRKSLRHLDVLKSKWTFQPITTPAMDKAAEFWAASRKRGTPTASEKALDIDVILAAQAWEMTLDGSFVLIATTNQKHLAQYVPAEHWKDIHP